jgi:catechol 2,3-dioxygenase-like lactoylglutathione lyase family enzyme
MITTTRFGTRDLARAKAFWSVIAEMVGAKQIYDRPNLIAFRGDEGSMLLIGIPLQGEHEVGNGNMAGFQVASRAQVDAVHARALEVGGTDEGAPGVRGDDPNGFYGAYFRDPDGNKLAVFRFGPPDA